MAPDLTVVHCPGLPTRSARVVWLLEELGLPYSVSQIGVALQLMLRISSEKYLTWNMYHFRDGRNILFCLSTRGAAVFVGDPGKARAPRSGF